MEERFRLGVEGIGSVSAALSMPGGELNCGVVTAHGQANDLDHDLLKAFGKGLAERGYACLRFNFPYREVGKKSPDDVETLMKSYRAARDELVRRMGDATIILAGKSLGARIASYVAESDGARGLIFLGYAIHRPGAEPENYDHLLKIEAPMLFYAGTRDPFCDVEKLERILEKREHPSSLQVVEGGNHSFVLPKSDDRPVELIYQNIASVAADWLDEYI